MVILAQEALTMPDSNPSDSGSRSSSPGAGVPHRRVVSGSLRDRIAKFNNPDAPPPVPKKYTPPAPVQRGLIGNRIPSLDPKTAGILGKAPEKRVVENKGLIGNRIPSLSSGGYNPLLYQNTGSSSGKPAPRSASPAGSVDSSAASATVDSNVSPITSRSSTPPSSPGTAGNAPSNLVASTLPSLNVDLGASTPSSTRAEAGDTMSELALSVPSTPIGGDAPPLSAAEYDLVPPNLKLAASGQVPNPMARGLSQQSVGVTPSISSSLATQSVGSEEENQMMADVSGVSTPMGTPKAERQELREGSVADDDELKDLAAKTENLGIVENTPPGAESVPATPTKEIPEPISAETPTPFSDPSTESAQRDSPVSGPPTPKSTASDPNKAPDLHLLKAGALSSPSPRSSTSPEQAQGGIDEMVSAALAQNLDEYTVAGNEKKVQGGRAGQYMEDVEHPDEVVLPAGDATSEAGESEKEELEVKDLSSPQEKVQVDEEPVERDVPAVDQAQKTEQEQSEAAESEIPDVVGNESEQPDAVLPASHVVAAEESPEVDLKEAEEKPSVVAAEESVPDVSDKSQGVNQPDEDKVPELHDDVVAGNPSDEDVKVAAPEEKAQPSDLEDAEEEASIKTDEEAAEVPEVVNVGKEVPAIQTANASLESEDPSEPRPVQTDDGASEQSEVVMGKAPSAQSDETPIVPETLTEQPSIAALGLEAKAEDVAGKQLEFEPAIVKPEIDPEAKADAPKDEETPVVKEPSFPSPPAADPDIEDPIPSAPESLTGASLLIPTPTSPVGDVPETPIDNSMLKYFPEVPDEQKPRVEVHVSSPAVTPARTKRTSETQATSPQSPTVNLPASGSAKSLKEVSSPVNLPGQSKSLNTSTPSKSSPAELSQQLDAPMLDTTPSQTDKLAKRNSTRRSPKSPLLDDEDPGDFEPGEGWATVIK
ncbi:hypothetical protein L198_03815 [Cryptococcus wingfieldii CBS 7118]|uniref:Altered inheritance of mitochondria protein 21 n=1 Tax=Cryptococcus wingfieldii CBS 7118 TaxID=1295528 RepID=A0A1E3J8T2_9TREE|nr:hypothetical protein L198_03815 [Cryptococcus wingfieldii CBS 7118]ODN97252.1 hypothetical protein L198_03815 [Cryptococcus wingfieldii CBS 7118]